MPGKTSVVPTINDQGETEVQVKQEPLSYVGFANDKDLYFKLGYSLKSEIQATVGAEWLFFRVGNIKGGVFAEGNAYFAGPESTRHDNLEGVAGVVGHYLPNYMNGK